TATIMFGHVDSPRSWARHLLRVRELQQRTGGFTELVPLPFVHMEAPIYLKGLARRGPTFREALLIHAVARLALHPWITNIQASSRRGRAGLRPSASPRPSARRRWPSRSTRRSTRGGCVGRPGSSGRALPPPDLEAARVARLATVDPWGRPHVVPICFVIDGD